MKEIIMSWSVSTSGKPGEVVKHLEAESGKVSGQAKVEYDEALPHLVGLVNQNFNPKDNDQPTIEISANGHGSESGGKQLNRRCAVSIKVVGMLLLAIILSLTSRPLQAADRYNSLLQPDKVAASELAPLQAPAKEAAQVQAPFQKQVQAPFQKSAIQKSAVQKSIIQRAEHDRRFLRERARDRRASRLEARADRAAALGGC